MRDETLRLMRDNGSSSNHCWAWELQGLSALFRRAECELGRPLFSLTNSFVLLSRSTLSSRDRECDRKRQLAVHEREQRLSQLLLNEGCLVMLVKLSLSGHLHQNIQQRLQPLLRNAFE